MVSPSFQLQAYERLLQNYPQWTGQTVLMLVTSPSPTESLALGTRVSELVDHINVRLLRWLCTGVLTDSLADIIFFSGQVRQSEIPACAPLPPDDRPRRVLCSPERGRSRSRHVHPRRYEHDLVSFSLFRGKVFAPC